MSSKRGVELVGRRYKQRLTSSGREYRSNARKAIRGLHPLQCVGRRKQCDRCSRNDSSLSE